MHEKLRAHFRDLRKYSAREKNHEKAMKSQRQPEKAVKNPQNQVCAKRIQKGLVCDFMTKFSHECSHSVRLLLILRCIIIYVLSFYEAFSHFGPLLKWPR